MAEGKTENPAMDVVTGSAGAVVEHGPIGPRVSREHGQVDVSLPVGSGPVRERNFARMSPGHFGGGVSGATNQAALVDLIDDYERYQMVGGPAMADRINLLTNQGKIAPAEKPWLSDMLEFRSFYYGLYEVTKGGSQKEAKKEFHIGPELIKSLLDNVEIRQLVVKYGKAIQSGNLQETASDGVTLIANLCNPQRGLPLPDLIALQMVGWWNVYPDPQAQPVAYKTWASFHGPMANILTPLERNKYLQAFFHINDANYTLRMRAQDSTGAPKVGYNGTPIYWGGSYLEHCGFTLDDLRNNWNDPAFQAQLKGSASYLGNTEKANATVVAMGELVTAGEVDGKGIRGKLLPVFEHIPDDVETGPVGAKKKLRDVVREKIVEGAKTEVQKNTVKDLRDEIEGTREYLDSEAQVALKKIEDHRIAGKINEQSARDLGKEVVTRKTKGSFLSKIGKPQFILGARGPNFGPLIIADVAGLIPFIDFEKTGWYKGVKRWTGISVPVAAEMAFIWSQTNDIFLAFGANWGTLLLYLGTNVAINLADDLIFHQGWTLKAWEGKK